MSLDEKRKHVRTGFSAEVKLMHPAIGSLCAETRDMSNGGLFLLTGDRLDLPLGAEVTVQSLDMAEDAPIIRATIVRIESEGIALMFCED